MEKLRSAIKPTLLRLALLRGTCLAALGSGIMVFAGSMMPPALLLMWGFLIFGVGLGLICWGLLPYRRLYRLALQPYELLLGKEAFLFKARSLSFTVPLSAISRMDHLEGTKNYGIRLWLKNPPPEKIIVHTPTLDMNAYQARSQQRHGCDLFLPYFTSRSFKSLKAGLDDVVHLDDADDGLVGF